MFVHLVILKESLRLIGVLKDVRGCHSALERSPQDFERADAVSIASQKQNLIKVFYAYIRPR